jgi:DNA repair exonuclease SbcCD ATPase subunit
MMILDEYTSTEEMKRRGQEALVQLENESTENATQISKVEAGIAVIRSTRVDRTQEQQRKTAHVAHLQEQHNQAVNFAKLAQGTIREKDCLSQVAKTRKKLAEHKQSLQSLESEIAEAEQKSQAREQELTTTLQTLLAEQERIQAEIHGTQAAHGQAHEELGNHLHTTALQAYQERQKRIEDLKSQLVEAQAEQLDFHEAALKELAPWPELQSDIVRLKPPEDTVTRAIDASHYYAETMLQEIKALAPHWKIPLPSLPSGHHILDAIMVYDGEILAARQDQRALKYRVDLIKKLRDEYHAHLAANNK